MSRKLEDALAAAAAVTAAASAAAVHQRQQAQEEEERQQLQHEEQRQRDCLHERLLCIEQWVGTADVTLEGVRRDAEALGAVVDDAAWQAAVPREGVAGGEQGAAASAEAQLAGRLLASAGDDGMVRLWRCVEAAMECVD